MEDLWWLCGLISGVITAVYIYFNQILKMPTAMFMIYRGVGLALAMLPFSYFFPFHPGWQFWGLCMLSGLLIAYSDNRFFNTATNYGAEISSALQPLSIVITFFLWLAIDSSQLTEYWHSPLRFFFILLCLGGFTAASIMLRQTSANYRVLKYLLPGVIMIAAIDNLQKIIMGLDVAQIGAASFYYLMITSFFAGLGNMIVFVRKERNLRMLLVPRNIFCGMSIVSLAGIAVIFKNFAMAYTPNPAYVSVLIFLYPVWIMSVNNIYLHFKKYIGYERISKNLLFLLLVSVVGLIIFAQG